jgi:cobalt/nickel transport system permease protein
MWAMAAVLATQALVFGDGGCGALGANLLTMAVTAPWTAWLAFRGLARCGLTDRDGSARSTDFGREAFCWGLASLASVLAAATVCSLVLAWGGAAPAAVVVPAMLLAHLPVGIVEAIATAAVVLLAAGRIALPMRSRAALESRAPLAAGRIGWLGLAPRGAGSTSATRVLLALSATVAVLLAPLASSAPDGLETVAARLGFLRPAEGGFAGLLPGYELPGVGWAPLAVALAGLVGVAAVSATGWLVGRATKGVRKSR